MQLRLWLSVLSLSCTLFAHAAPKAPAPQVKVEFVSGNVTFTNRGGGGIVRVGQVINQGDQIFTATNSYVDFACTYYSVRCNPDTALTVKTMSFRDGLDAPSMDAAFAVTNGSILCNVRQLRSSFSKFIVDMRQGTMIIAGTEFLVNADGLCRCAQGSFNVNYPTLGPAKNGGKVWTASTTNYHASAFLRSGFSCEPPPRSSNDAVVYQTPPEIGRSLERDLEDLKKHRVRKPR